MHVLEGGPWTILGHYLTVIKWRPTFIPTKETVTKTLIWVRFPSVPSELLDEEFIVSMGDRSRTIKVDEISLTGLRAKFVRCCVEIDLSAPLIPSLTVFDFEQKVEYEGLYLIYFECEVYGHGSGDCPGIHQPGELMEKFESTRQQTTGDKPVGPTKSQSPYGPWMMPSFSRKQPSRQNKFQ